MRRTVLGVLVLATSCGPGPANDTITCTEGDLASGCNVGACHLSGARGSLGGGTVRLTRISIPTELRDDVLGDTMCAIVLPPGRPDAASLQLTVTTGVDVKPDSALFEQASTTDPSTLIVSSQTLDAHTVSGLVRRSASYGVTRRPSPWTADAVIGVDVGSSSDPAYRLRNISSKRIVGAWFDGTRLYLGSGNRVLIWKTMPANALTPPDVVLGQPDLDANIRATSAAIWQSGVAAIWSDGAKLLVAAGNRILVWNSIPTASGAPADLVLGQPDFGTDAPNAGGVSATTLDAAFGIDSDGTRILVSDVHNHRTLAWSTWPTSIGQPATGVIGQPTFNTSTPNGGATRLYQTYSAILDGPGAFVAGYFYDNVVHVSSLSVNPATDFGVFASTEPRVRPDSCRLAGGVARLSSGLAARDAFGQRVAVFAGVPTTTTPLDFVLGQPDPFRTVWHPTSASTMGGYGTYGFAGTGDMLLVADDNRLLVYEKPAYNFAPATRLIGQASYAFNDPAVDYRTISERSLGAPADLAVNATTLAVADAGNNRVLLFDLQEVAAPSPRARAILGQPDASGFMMGAGSGGLSAPAGVALDDTHLVVADTHNHRVLIWNGLPDKSGAPADVVLGQADFGGTLPNRGRGDTSPKDGYSDAAADGFFYPMGVATDGVHLAVADRMNNRVLIWKTWPKSNGRAADVVIGQDTFAGLLPNRGKGPFAVAPDGLNLPLGVTIANGALWIADTENNRVVRWDAPWSAPVVGAVLGQPDGSSVTNPNIASDPASAGAPLEPPTTSTSVVRPRAIAVTKDRIFISEPLSNRVHVFDAAGTTPIAVLGQTKWDRADANADGLGPASLWVPLGIAANDTHLYVVDQRNNRALRWSGAALSGAPASEVVGQSSMYTGAFDRGGAAKNGVTTQPRGVAAWQGQTFVCDTENNRVLVFDPSVEAGKTPAYVFGQFDPVTTLPNAGGQPGAATLSGPRGVHVTDKWVAIADTINNRVLLFDRQQRGSAKVVLGQPDAHSIGRNRGEGPSAATMAAPEGVFVDGDSVYVADTGNNRVLVWSHVPTIGGAPADFVLGQADPAGALPNRGGGPTAASLLAPTGVLATRGMVWVADSGNNRVLRWAALQSGGPADAVLGQHAFGDRQPAATPADLVRLAGPSALATDGTFVYVLERDLNRIASFAVAAPSASGPERFYGSEGGLTMTSPRGLAAERTALFTTRLIVGDTGANRVVSVEGASRLR